MNLKDKRFFISGGAGVIGRLLVEQLLDQGALLMVGDFERQPRRWYGRLRYRQGDLNTLQAWELEDFQPEYFIHLAATFERSVEEREFWEENVDHNLKLSTHLLGLISDTQSVHRVIFASSYLIYDKGLYTGEEVPEEPVTLNEECRISPRNLCGAAKLNHETELTFLGGFESTRFTAASARIYRSYGPNSRDIVSRWIRSALKGETLTLFGEESFFDYIYAGDVAEGLLRLAGSDFEGVINLGSGQSRRVSEVIAILRSHFPELQVDTTASDIPYEASQADMRLFHEQLGWQPCTTLETAIATMIEHEKACPFQERDNVGFSVLVTSAAKKIPCLLAVRSAMNCSFSRLLGDTVNARLISADADSNCLARAFTDDFWQMPLLGDLSTEALLDFCKANGIGAIIPTRDGELAFFAERKDELRQQGVHVMISTPTAIEACTDKLQFARKLTEKGMPVIAAFTAPEQVDAEALVVKERHGAGSESILLNCTPEQAASHGATLSEPIYQPYIAGLEISVDLYITSSGECKGAVARTRDHVVTGESQVTTTIDDPEVCSLCSEAARYLELSGHSVWQVLRDPSGGLHIIECNARFGGASTASLAAGLDSFYWFLQEVESGSIEHIPFVRRRGQIRQVRHAADLVVPLA